MVLLMVCALQTTTFRVHGTRFFKQTISRNVTESSLHCAWSIDDQLCPKSNYARTESVPTCTCMFACSGYLLSSQDSGNERLHIVDEKVRGGKGLSWVKSIRASGHLMYKSPFLYTCGGAERTRGSPQSNQETKAHTGHNSTKTHS